MLMQTSDQPITTCHSNQNIMQFNVSTVLGSVFRWNQLMKIHTVFHRASRFRAKVVLLHGTMIVWQFRHNVSRNYYLNSASCKIHFIRAKTIIEDTNINTLI